MIDTFPQTFIAVGALNIPRCGSFFCQITNSMPFYLLYNQTFITIIKIASYQKLGFRCHSLNRIYRLTKAVCSCLTERPTVFLAPITTGEMNHKDMKRIA